MLLPSDRHTAADLRHWQELENADVRHGRGESVRRKAKRAISEITKFARADCYAATSFGKDSVVMHHLVWRSQVSIPVALIRQEGPGEDPYQMDVLNAWEWGNTEIVFTQLRDFDSGRSPALEDGIKTLQAKYGKRYVSGIRADESPIRKLRSFMLNNSSSCWPLRDWSAADVFGYIAANGLPLHPAYAMTGGGRWNRNQIRVSTIGGHKGSGFGRSEWEREYYGDILNRMKAY